MATVQDVAARILKKTGATGSMKLQKLCYFAYGWYRVTIGQELFSERFQAWEHGPVVPALYSHHRRQTSVDEIPGDPENLSTAEAYVVDTIVDFYNPLSGWDLREMSHQHSCWKRNYLDLPPDQRYGNTITEAEIAETFEALKQNERSA